MDQFFFIYLPITVIKFTRTDLRLQIISHIKTVQIHQISQVFHQSSSCSGIVHHFSHCSCFHFHICYDFGLLEADEHEHEQFRHS